MKITVDVTGQQVADLLTSAIEGGDPVTTASKGGWCNGVYYRTKDTEPPKGLWYTDAGWCASRGFQIEVHEVADENTWKRGAEDAVNVASGALVIHRIRHRQLLIGLAHMAKNHPEEFGQIISGNIDAPCADTFLQCVLFGDMKFG